MNSGMCESSLEETNGEKNELCTGWLTVIISFYFWLNSGTVYCGKMK